MERTKLCKTLIAAALIGTTVMGSSALADPFRGLVASNLEVNPQGALADTSQGVVTSNLGMDTKAWWSHEYLSGGFDSAFEKGLAVTHAYASVANLNLTGDQRAKIAKIHMRVRHTHRGLMGKMQALHSHMNRQYSQVPRDDAVLNKTYGHMSELRQEIFDQSLSAQKEIYSALGQAQGAAVKIE